MVAKNGLSLFLSPALVRELATPAVVLGDHGVVLDVGGGVVVDLVVDHLRTQQIRNHGDRKLRWVAYLGLGELEDEHGGGEHHGDEAKGEGLPGLERDQGHGDGQQGGGLELQAQHEGDQHFLDEATA